MHSKWKFLGYGGAIFCLLFVLFSNRPPAPKPINPTPAKTEPSTPATTVEQTAAIEPAIPAEPINEPQVQPSFKSKPAAKVQSQNQTSKPSEEPLHDPDARDALALVGIDPDAEQYWLEAIYDTSLPDNEREDLMEDLNEVGFADPDNVTVDDLPLIMSRLEMIEYILPNTDDFMRPHLLEAEKDLVNMLGQATR